MLIIYDKNLEENMHKNQKSVMDTKPFKCYKYQFYKQFIAPKRKQYNTEELG